MPLRQAGPPRWTRSGRAAAPPRLRRRWRPPRPPGDRPARRTGLREAVLPSLARTGTFVLVAALGWLLAENRDWVGTYRSDTYLTVAGTLLAVGLYASTYGIDLGAARRNVRLVVLAISGGVVVKAALISAVMYLAFREPAYLVLGVAVAQIDPVSFAAARLQSRMSAQAKTILSAWASFDDPITVLLTVYAAAWVWPLVPADPAAATAPPHTGLESFGLSLAQNLALAGVAALVWWGTERLRRWVPGRLVTALQIVALAGLAAVAVWQFLMLALAVAGLFYRPPLGDVLDRLTQGAFLAASFALGLVLVGGISPLAGVVLGLAAVGAHVVVALVIGWRLPRSDRVDVLLGQQNGITAIILALVLERQFVGTVAAVAPAILTINVLHALGNGLRETYRRPVPAVDLPAPPLNPRRG
ncbi:hypothetical protein [Micromonospora sp. NPDC023956]|uniref:hypothetical protein n=1 Tax=Micromonospora sp. NPDC023956 TaxID=3155722 RepID=UPI0033C49E1E